MTETQVKLFPYSSSIPIIYQYHGRNLFTHNRDGFDLFTASEIHHTNSLDNTNFSTEAQVRGIASLLHMRKVISPEQWQQWTAAVSSSLGLVNMAWPQARGLTCDHRPRCLLLRRYAMLMGPTDETAAVHCCHCSGHMRKVLAIPVELVVCASVRVY